jgi:4-hydroxybenzoate polyprenyltransferase
MSTEPGRVDQTPPRRNRGVWGGIAVCTGAAFAIIALLHAPGIVYAIVAIVAGLAYSLATMYARRGG